MLQIPLAFKGPANQLESLFSQDLIYSALKLLLRDNLIHWQHDELLETVNAVIEDEGRLHKLSINWPLDSEISLGTCPCKNPNPCVHICATVIESKARIDQLPPFTQQLQANRNIQQTLATWINKQTYDPYPNMARHRLVYFLDCDENEKNFTISLHKAYLSKDDRFTAKAQLDSSLLQQKPLPKFVSLTDQIILNSLQKKGIIKQHNFHLESNRDEVLIKQILQTGRCFWKNCYRPALTFENSSDITAKMVNVLATVYISIYQNNVTFKTTALPNKKILQINSNKEITPQLCLQSHEISVLLDYEKTINIDLATISFRQGQSQFNFEDLSTGVVQADAELINRLAAYLRQIEKLDSLQAHYELALLDNYHINDRYISDDLATFATLICALKEEGWYITIHDNFRLNQINVDSWYASLQSDEDYHWFDLELGVKVDGKKVNILPYLVKSIKSGKWQSNNQENFLLKLEDGTNISVEHNSIQQVLSTLSELYDEKSLNKQETLTLANNQLIRLNQLEKKLNKQSKIKEVHWQGDTWLQDKANELAGTIGLKLIKPPHNLTVQLRDYQEVGLSWLQFLSQHSLGGILADDMGLGKTLQILAHLLTEKNNDKLKSPCLIVVPTSLLSNWQSEINKFAPDLSCLLLIGSNRKKLYENIHRFDIIITSYGIMNRDCELLSEYNFYYLILDEAQTIKNSKTRAAQSASKIPSTHRLCLSGTPIENHLGELWSLFNFLMPGFLGQLKQFEHIYQFPIEKEKNQQRQIDLSQRVSPFMLRRTKNEVAKELPEKTEIVQIIELDESQANMYESVRITMSNEIKQAFDKSQTAAPNKIIIGNALLRLRQICCHPALLNLDSMSKNPESAKLNWLTTVLPNMVEEGRKILLFSSFTTMLDIIANHLNIMNIDSLMLTGKTPATKRGGLIEQFQNTSVPVFLISLKAGGAGINLTAADTVIHFDPWWNPAAEAQASDRAHRIGQDKNVFVYKLITKGTVEQRIQKMQKHKEALAQSIFDGQGNISSVLNSSHWLEFLKPIG